MEALEAVRLIEREYFDGTNILYREDEAYLLEHIQVLRRMIEKVRGYLEQPAPVVRSKRTPREAPRPPDLRMRDVVRKGALRRARSMIVTAKYRVLYDLGEQTKAYRILDEHVAEGAIVSGRPPPRR